MIFDTHAHYNDPRFDTDRDELLASLPGAGVGRVLMPGTSIEEQPLILEIAARYDFIRAAAGIHPHYTASVEDLSALEGYLRNAAAHKIAAVGECGLDYFAAEGCPPPDRAAQRGLFDAQLCLAERYKLPVIVHDRDAHGDCLDIIRAHRGVPRYVFHCFSGGADLAAALCGMEVYCSFTGSVTYKKNAALREAAAAVPDELIMVETDAPYLSPEPVRGRRCDSLMIPHILAVLARARGVTEEEAETLTFENAARFFGPM
ncbi:MAG: TatD family hydrolase [Oscillospiraceae bacterium]|nr:TatD family hydrolase [Oscillospiraceae bacterium]